MLLMGTLVYFKWELAVHYDCGEMDEEITQKFMQCIRRVEEECGESGFRSTTSSQRM